MTAARQATNDAERAAAETAAELQVVTASRDKLATQLRELSGQLSSIRAEVKQQEEAQVSPVKVAHKDHRLALAEKQVLKAELEVRLRRCCCSLGDHAPDARARCSDGVAGAGTGAHADAADTAAAVRLLVLVWCWAAVAVLCCWQVTSMREAMNGKAQEAEAARQQVTDTEAQLALANRRMARLQQVFETVMAAREEERQSEATAAAARERAAVAATGRLEAALKGKEAEVADARNRLASAAALHSRAEGLAAQVADVSRQLDAERRCAGLAAPCTAMIVHSRCVRARARACVCVCVRVCI